MSRFRLAGLALVGVALLIALDSRILAQVPDEDQLQAVREPKPAAGPNDSTCVVHPLGVLGDDPKFGKWIVDTIPEMVQPGTWTTRTEDGAARRRISYYAPGKVIVVCHTPKVQAEVKAFLADMQKSVARPSVVQVRGTGTPDLNVVPAQLAEVRSARAEPIAGTRGAYPVPTAEKQPKHLFHLIIRYEGDGLDGATLAGLMGQLGAADMNKEGGDKPAPDVDKSTTPLGQLLHFIVRYEGEGIIDSNVAALLKDIYGANAGVRGPVPVCEPSPPPATNAVPPTTGPPSAAPVGAYSTTGSNSPSSGPPPATSPASTPNPTTNNLPPPLPRNTNQPPANTPAPSAPASPLQSIGR